MPQVSAYPIKEEVYERILELLTKTITDSCNKQEAINLIEDLLTSTEKIMLAKRLAIAVLLSKGYTYESIGAILRVSRPTIAMVNMSLKFKGEGYKKFAQKVLKEEKMQEFWERVEDKVLSAFSHGKGSGPWRYLRHERRKEHWKKKTEI